MSKGTLAEKKFSIESSWKNSYEIRSAIESAAWQLGLDINYEQDKGGTMAKSVYHFTVGGATEFVDFFMDAIDKWIREEAEATLA